MATRFHIGAKSLRGDIASYAKRFDLLEVAVVAAEDLRLMPAASTLRRWRKAVPPHFEFSVIAGPAMGKLKDSPAFEEELLAFTQTQDTLEARVVVVKTPPEITPSPAWRDRLRTFVDRIRRDATTIVWECSGLWEVEDAARFAKKIDVVVAIDPARDTVPDGHVAYGRLRALGETRSFGPAAMDRVALNIGDRRDAYVVIETDPALTECRSLRKAAIRARQNQKGGMGRLLRPRSRVNLVAHDDEQE
jgi:uncharacterized protein YecE (DUF72 family)